MALHIPDHVRIGPARYDKGLGLFATTKYDVGDQVFETPTAFVDIGDYDQLSDMSSEMFHKEGIRIGSAMDVLLKDYTNYSHEVEESNINDGPSSTHLNKEMTTEKQTHMVLTKRFSQNDMGQSDIEQSVDNVQKFLEGSHYHPGFKDRGVHGYSTLTKLVNHACVPNCILSGSFSQQDILSRGWTVGRSQIRAVLPIGIGEEITISYDLDLGRGAETRRRTLEQRFEFYCKCSKCVEETQIQREAMGNIGRDWTLFFKTTDTHASVLYRTASSLLTNLTNEGITGFPCAQVYMHLLKITEYYADAIRMEYFLRLYLAWCHTSYGCDHPITTKHLVDLQNLKRAGCIDNPERFLSASTIDFIEDRNDPAVHKLMFMVDHNENHYYRLYIEKGVLYEESKSETIRRGASILTRMSRSRQRDELESSIEQTMAAIPDFFKLAEKEIELEQLYQSLACGSTVSKAADVRPNSQKRRKKKNKKKNGNSRPKVQEPSIGKVDSQSEEDLPQVTEKQVDEEMQHCLPLPQAERQTQIDASVVQCDSDQNISIAIAPREQSNTESMGSTMIHTSSSCDCDQGPSLEEDWTLNGPCDMQEGIDNSESATYSVWEFVEFAHILTKVTDSDAEEDLLARKCGTMGKRFRRMAVIGEREYDTGRSCHLEDNDEDDRPSMLRSFRKCRLSE